MCRQTTTMIVVFPGWWCSISMRIRQASAAARSVEQQSEGTRRLAAWTPPAVLRGFKSLRGSSEHPGSRSASCAPDFSFPVRCLVTAARSARLTASPPGPRPTAPPAPAGSLHRPGHRHRRDDGALWVANRCRDRRHPGLTFGHRLRQPRRRTSARVRSVKVASEASTARWTEASAHAVSTLAPDPALRQPGPQRDGVPHPDVGSPHRDPDAGATRRAGRPARSRRPVRAGRGRTSADAGSRRNLGAPAASTASRGPGHQRPWRPGLATRAPRGRPQVGAWPWAARSRRRSARPVGPTALTCSTCTALSSTRCR